MKRINKILWHGNEIPLPSAYEGSLDGLNMGELFIYEDDEDPAIFIKTNKNKVKRIGGGGGGTTDINEILDLIDQKLNGYATEEWVSSTYATKTALSTLSSSVNSLRTDFDNLNALLNDDVTGKINTWYEVVDFLDEYSGSQDLAAILSGMNTDIASRVEKSKFAEYFSTEMAKWFVKDDTNRGIKPVNSYGLYSDTYVSAKGVSTGTGGSGGGGTSYDRLDAWAEYTSSKAGYVLSALLGYDLHTRVNSLANAGYITASALSGYAKLSDIPTSLPASDVYSWAKAANKPSYAFSEITGKPTTLGGYGIVDAYTATTIDSKLSGYLPLSGGTINGDLILDSKNNSRWLQFQTWSGTGYIGYRSNVDNWYLTNKNWANEYIVIHSGNYSDYALPLSGGFISSSGWRNQLNILRAEAADSIIGFFNSNADNYLGAIGFDNSLNPIVNIKNAGNYNLIHSGNIGSQSVSYAASAGNANELDGYNLITEVTDWNSVPNTILKSSESNTANAPCADYCYGAVLRFHRRSSTFYTDLVTSLYYDLLFYRRHSNQGYGGWKQIAFTDSNVASATKLQTPRTIWGQSFDGTGNVSGDISVFTHKLYWHYAASSYYIACPTTSTGAYLEYAGYEGHRFRAANEEAMRITSTGNILIGTTTDNGAKLQVGGSVVASGSVTAKSSSDYRLKCEFDYNVDYQERLLSLGKVCDFNYTPHAQEREFAFADDKRHTSVIWQDARKANITGFCSVEEDGYGTVNPLSSDLIFTMVGAIQQGITKTEKIEERVVRLEKENEALRREINDMRGGNYGC